MSAEVWATMIIAACAFVTLIGAMIIGLVKVSSSVTAAVTKFETIGQQQANEISRLSGTVERLSNVVIDIATQKVRMDSQGDRMNLADKNNGERFQAIEGQLKQLFLLYSELKRGEGFIIERKA